MTWILLELQGLRWHKLEFAPKFCPTTIQKCVDSRCLFASKYWKHQVMFVCCGLFQIQAGLFNYGSWENLIGYATIIGGYTHYRKHRIAWDMFEITDATLLVAFTCELFIFKNYIVLQIDLFVNIAMRFIFFFFVF